MAFFALRHESGAAGPFAMAWNREHSDAEGVLPWEPGWKREASLSSRGSGLPGGDNLSPKRLWAVLGGSGFSGRVASFPQCGPDTQATLILRSHSAQFSPRSSHAEG
ncbi:MAG: hypothetical protein IPP78_12835 [Holophagaceae bacterium]|nr:hypothetical protein [Holophagaceae bacterium]